MTAAVSEQHSANAVPPMVVFSHGSDSGPVGTKINALATVAERHGCAWVSIDYRGIADPTARVHKLVAERQASWGRPILVGSSLGAHVCTAASVALNARSLFLMAPAFYMPGFEALTPTPHACPVTLVHGWWDDVVPVSHSVRFANTHHSYLHLLPGDHRLTEQLAEIEVLFAQHLRRDGVCG
jgi:alpha/beta superfamily hydrolase